MQEIFGETEAQERRTSHNGCEAFGVQSNGILILVARGLEASSRDCGGGVGGGGASRRRMREMSAQTPLLEVAPHIRRLRICSVGGSSSCRRVCVRAASASGPVVGAPEALDGGAQKVIPAEAVEVCAVVREERVRVARRRRSGRTLAAGDGVLLPGSE